MGYVMYKSLCVLFLNGKQERGAGGVSEGESGSLVGVEVVVGWDPRWLRGLYCGPKGGGK
jgi:hypothetical protein